VACSKTPQALPGSLLFQSVRVFDGARVLPSRDVLVEDGRIKAIGGNQSPAAGAIVINGTGQTLLPGLIDAHTHAPIAALLQQAVMFGVTTQLDMYSDPASIRAAKAFARAPGSQAADLFGAGLGVTAPGGHGTEYSAATPTVAGPDDARAFVDAQVAEGSDYIKVIYDDGLETATPFTSISRKTLEAAIDEAHRRTRLAVVHILSAEAARDAAEAGADGLAHTFVDRVPDGRVVDAIASHRTFVIPTLVMIESLTNHSGEPGWTLDDGLRPYLSAASSRTFASRFPFHPEAPANYAAAEESVRAFRSAGISILAGSDGGNPGTAHGASLHRELELLVRAGLDPIEALRAATSVPAEKFHLRDRGRIAPGLRADLLLVKGNPTTDILATRQISGVWKAGVRIDRAAYRNRLDRQSSVYELAKSGRTREAIATYDAYKTADGGTQLMDEGTLNTLGYELLRSNQVGAAIEIFRLAVREHPNSSNVYDSLGEAYKMHGDIELAIRNYEKSLSLNPKNANATKVLEKLRR
jgi:imidazolonepropionase-like amidohydrolase